MLRKIVDFFKTLKGRFVLSIICIVLVIILAVMLFRLFPVLQEVKLCDGLTTEFLGMFFIFLVIDYYRDQEAKKQAELRETEAKKLQEQREEEALQVYKKDLIRQARSRNNNTALDAIDIIREEGWLDGRKDGVKLLEGVTGAEIILTNANLTAANLSCAKLGWTDLSEANLTNAELSGADLTGTKFHRAKLIATRFVGSTLHGTDFTEAIISVTDKEILEDDKEIVRFKVRQGEQQTSNANFTAQAPVIFKGARLSGKKVKIKQQDGSEKEKLIYLDLSSLDLSEISFQGATLHHVKFSASILKNCNFTQTSLTNVYFTEATLSGARFSGKFQSEKQDNEDEVITFTQAIMDSVDLSNCEFIKVDFTSVQTFNMANCTQASFSESDFSGAIMTNMMVKNTIFRKITMNGDTVLFDDMNMKKYWLDCYPHPITPSVDLQEIQNAFTKKINKLVDQHGVEEFTATIELPEHSIKLRNEKGTEEDIYQLIEEPDRKIEVKVSYQRPRQLSIISSESLKVEDDEEDY